MKKIYVLETRIYNGTVLHSNGMSAFSTEELAEKAANKIEEINKNSEFFLFAQITEADYYESEKDVPILQ